MKSAFPFATTKVLAILCFLAIGSGIRPASAVLSTLTSPDNTWSLSSDEFGAFGEWLPGSFAQRDFGNGAGLTGYSFVSSVFLTDGANQQWLASDAAFAVAGMVPIGAGSVISDNTVGNVRTSVFSVPNFPDLQVNLTQTAANSGITQEYSITNNGVFTADLRLMSFHDVDLDASTFGSNIIAAGGSTLEVSDGSRSVFFNASPVGYGGFLAGHFVGGGISGNLDVFGVNNLGIPAANVGQFVGFGGNGVINADFDVDLDQISDSASDVGYLFQNDIAIDPGQTLSLAFGHAAIPEPSAALLGLLALGLSARRRR